MLVYVCVHVRMYIYIYIYILYIHTYSKCMYVLCTHTYKCIICIYTYIYIASTSNKAYTCQVNKLMEEMVKPAHLIVGEGEELTEEQQRELKVWEAAAKALAAEQEAYRKGLEAELKKLKSEIHEECRKFDDSMQVAFVVCMSM